MSGDSSIGERMAVENGTNNLWAYDRLSLFLTARGPRYGLFVLYQCETRSGVRMLSFKNFQIFGY
jgi:hypothetical protein